MKFRFGVNQPRATTQRNACRNRARSLHRLPAATIIAAILGLSCNAMAQTNKPVTIRIGWIGAPGELQAIMFPKPGMAKHRGITYALDPVRFQASNLEITALAAGELEIAGLGFSSIAFAILNGGMADIRIIADEFRDGADGYYSFPYEVLKTSPIQKIEDLKGKIIAVNGFGSGSDMPMQGVLLDHGLVAKKDYTVIEAPYGAMRAVLADGKADVVTVPHPFDMQPEMQNIGRVLFRAKEAFGPQETGFWTARAAFIQQHRPALVDLIEDYIAAIRWYTDPANHSEVVNIVANFNKLPAASISAWVLTTEDWYHDRNATPDLGAIQKNIDGIKRAGFIKSSVEIAPYADLSLVEEAVSRSR